MGARVEWPGGWAELTDRLTHARRIRAVSAMPTDTSDTVATLRFAGELAAAHIVAWSEGAVDPVHGPDPGAIDALPSDAIDEITQAATALWSGRADPNATAPTSDAGPSESASA